MNRTFTAVLGAAWIGTFAGALACGGSGSGTTGGGGAGGSAGAGGGGGGPGRGGASGAGGATGSDGATGAGGTADAAAPDAAAPGAGGTSGAGGNNDAGVADSSNDTEAGDARNDAPTDLLPSIPEGSDGGLPHPKMSFFVTSEGNRTGNLGGLAMADDQCQHFGASGGLGDKTWKAYLSTTTVNAIDRIGTGPWFNFKGEMIAENLAQLHEVGGLKNNLTQGTALTNTGRIVPGRTGFVNEQDILTGSLRSGVVKPNAHCNNWTSTTGSSGVGHVDRMGVEADPVAAASWNDAHEGQCNNTRTGGGAGRLYCFATN